jgi:hypothetical protein
MTEEVVIALRNKGISLRGQVPTRQATALEILRSLHFAAGVDDVRGGRPPRFDMVWPTLTGSTPTHRERINNAWNYERGRFWAILAPKNLSLDNPLAVRLLDAAFDRRWII